LIPERSHSEWLLGIGVEVIRGVHALAVDGNKYLVEMPTPIRAGSRASKFVCISQTELHRPAPDALVGNVYAAFGKEVFDIPEAQE